MIDKITKEPKWALLIRLSLWEATFLKYESWKANGAKSVPIDELMKDINQCMASGYNEPTGGEEG